MRMDFDYCIGNPPYQLDVEGTSAKNIYPDFVLSGTTMAKKTVMITPARAFGGAGKYDSSVMKRIMDMDGFQVEEYIEDPSTVFPGNDIEGGLIILSWEKGKSNTAGFKKFLFPPIVFEILEKVKMLGESSIVELIHSSGAYRFSDTAKKEAAEQLGKLTTISMFPTSVFTTSPELFLLERPSSGEYTRIYGRIKGRRAVRYLRSSFFQSELLGKWKVLVPKSNGSGKLEENSSTALIGRPMICDPRSGATQTYISFGGFENKLEAENAEKYITTKFARTMLGVLKITQHNPPRAWRYVPIQDFTDKSDIDWGMSVSDIDKQLYRKYNLSDEEINWVETHVKEMRS